MSNSLQLSEEGIKIAQEAFRRKYPSQEALAKELSEVHQCEVTRQPIGRFLKGKSISRQIFVWISEKLDIDINKVVKPLTEADFEITVIDCWHKICGDMLDAQKQNLRRQVTQMGFELNVYVPLGLVDRKQQSRRSSDFSLPPEQGSGFFQLSEEEIIKTYEHNEFLEQVIKQGQSKKSQGKRIAIIGEPGAGKTTLLEAIAFSPKTPGFPIWISLGSLGEKSLEEYLRQNWLKQALKTSEITQQQKELEELFKSGKVLLLLDGVDEMPASSPVEALAKIREELTGWVADARVVLTCRVNVWDASVNALQGFDTYRTLEFSYGDGDKPDQVKEFICQWFSNTDKPELGEPLRKTLEEDRHQRIRDLVKNPLRLSLLCQSWYFRQGDLPKTKAALYEQFREAFYDWKEEQFSTSPTKRKELNAALGLLAREAIDKEKSRFGIRDSFAIDVMGEDFFNLACKLHWLNLVYKDAETDEKVYAFFHPTFQECFAACAIPNWDYFLKHVPHNPKQGTYRIFKQQWKEVILLWLGREEVETNQKEVFIKALMEFEDRCTDFYGFRAYFLAAAGIAELKNCSLALADAIVTQMIKWLIATPGYSWLGREIRSVLQETDCRRVIDKLIPLLDDSRYKSERHDIIECLGRIGIEDFRVIEALTRIVDRQSENFCCREIAAYCLLKNANQNLKDKNVLNEFAAQINGINLYLKQTTSRNKNFNLYKKTIDDLHALGLKEFDYENLEADVVNIIKALNHLSRTNQDKGNRKVAWCLGVILFRKPFSPRSELLDLVITGFKDCTADQIRENSKVIWHCAKNMSYPDFYEAWHDKSSIAQVLENQLIDIPAQVQPTDKSYPIAIDTQTLKLETNTSTIAQKLCTKIYRKSSYSDIPTVNDAAQLQQYIPRIQEKLQKPNLALILHGCEPNEHLLNFCYSLADPDIGLYIGLITSQPIEQPLKGFLPNPPNLLSAIQSWIDEIG